MLALFVTTLPFSCVLVLFVFFVFPRAEGSEISNDMYEEGDWYSEGEWQGEAPSGYAHALVSSHPPVIDS